MPTFPNFYERIDEANMRLAHTLILYEGKPHYVFCVADHKPDGVFRVYMEPMPSGPDENGRCFYEHQKVNVPCEPYDGHKQMGKHMDEYLSSNEGKTRIIRKMMNSPAFNKFRPFPLGMVNNELSKRVTYVERSPTRHSQQGLTDTMLVANPLPSLDPSPSSEGIIKGLQPVNVMSPWLRKTIIGDYPHSLEALARVRSMGWSSCAFSRKFAFSRGPVGTVFLTNKTEAVGFLVSEDLQKVRISKDYRFLKETVEELNVFTSIEVEN